jgi:hypothetical protein
MPTTRALLREYVSGRGAINTPLRSRAALVGPSRARGPRHGARTDARRGGYVGECTAERGSGTLAKRNACATHCLTPYHHHHLRPLCICHCQRVSGTLSSNCRAIIGGTSWNSNKNYALMIDIRWTVGVSEGLRSIVRVHIFHSMLSKGLNAMYSTIRLPTLCLRRSTSLGHTP